MLKITRGQTNILTVTCREKQISIAPYYLILFKNDTGKKEKFCITSDISAYPNRYQSLTIIETNTPISGTNQVKLEITGSWKYTIWEQASSSNINPVGLNEVENGRVKVTDFVIAKKEYTGYQKIYEQNV